MEVSLGVVVGNDVGARVGKVAAVGAIVAAGVVAVSPTWQAARSASRNPTKQDFLACIVSSLIG